MRQAASPSSARRMAAGLPGQRGHARQPLALLVRLRQRRQVGQLLAQRVAQRQEVALAQRDEAAAAVARQVEQLAQAQHLAAVELEFAVELEPFALAAGLELDRRLGHRAHAHRLALGPFADDVLAQLAQALDRGQGLLGFVERPFVHVVVEEVERVEQLVEQRRARAPGRAAWTASGPGARWSRAAAAARRQARAEVAEGRSQQRQAQAGAVRRELGAQAAVGRRPRARPRHRWPPGSARPARAAPRPARRAPRPAPSSPAPPARPRAAAPGVSRTSLARPSPSGSSIRLRCRARCVRQRGGSSSSWASALRCSSVRTGSSRRKAMCSPCVMISSAGRPSLTSMKRVGSRSQATKGWRTSAGAASTMSSTGRLP